MANGVMTKIVTPTPMVDPAWTTATACATVCSQNHAHRTSSIRGSGDENCSIGGKRPAFCPSSENDTSQTTIRACVRVCVRAYVRASECACVRASEQMCAHRGGSKWASQMTH